MKISNLLADDAILAEIGQRIARRRWMVQDIAGGDASDKPTVVAESPQIAPTTPQVPTLAGPTAAPGQVPLLSGC